MKIKLIAKVKYWEFSSRCYAYHFVQILNFEIEMNYFSVFITLLLQQSAAQLETEESAKHYCEEWFVRQGEEIENVFFMYP